MSLAANAVQTSKINAVKSKLRTATSTDLFLIDSFVKQGRKLNDFYVDIIKQ
jgi:hypothetical protein